MRALDRSPKQEQEHDADQVQHQQDHICVLFEQEAALPHYRINNMHEPTAFLCQEIFGKFI